MENNIRYVHTNLIAKDWKNLANFYMNVFNCKPKPPERNLSGEWMDNLTNISKVSVRGMHLCLPGFENGPTLEIFEYFPSDSTVSENYINRNGFAHIAFHVDSVETVLKRVLENGGGQLGKIVTKEFESIGLLTVVYATDPEGNIVEIQNWTVENKIS